MCVYYIYTHAQVDMYFSYDSSISCSVSPGAQALTAPMKSDNKLQLPINKAPRELTSSGVVAVVWVTAAASENNDALVRHAFISPV